MSRIKKPPVMTGPFAKTADDFIQYKRSCGFKYEHEPRTKLSPMTIYQRYRRYLMDADISHGGKGYGPRLHDLRYPNLNKIQTFCR